MNNNIVIYHVGGEGRMGPIEKILGLKPADLSKEEFYSHEKRFKGPF